MRGRSPIVDEFNAALRDTPYSLPDDDRGARIAKDLHTKGERIRKRQQKSVAAFERRSTELKSQLATVMRARAVYESNAIERAGLPLQQTSELLAEFRGDRDRLDRHLAELSLTSDRQVMEVLGLERATHFAEHLAHEYLSEHRPLRAGDIRSIHAFTMPGERFAGAYRNHKVEIGGAHHIPPEPYEVPRMINALTDWMSQVRTDPLLVAAAAHSWIAAVHPFQDGNGRVSRLVANIALIRAGLPPLIVRNEDRAEYYDALAHSDEAGDLLPLYELFVAAAHRGLAALENPALAIEMFSQDTGRSVDAGYLSWKDGFLSLLYELEQAAGAQGYAVLRHGLPTASTYKALCARDSTANMWVARLRGIATDGDWLLWLGYTSDAWIQGMEYKGLPALYISQRDRSADALLPYKSPFVSTPLSIREIVVVASLGANIRVRRPEGWSALGPKQAALSLMADVGAATVD